jgi:hypothetical protein
VELQNKVENLETTQVFEKKLEGKLTAARNKVSFIIKIDKELLIQKSLEELYGGKPKSFKLLFESIEMFVDKVREAMEEPKREVKAVTNFLQSKVWQIVGV